MFVQLFTRFSTILFFAALLAVSSIAQSLAGDVNRGIQVEFPTGGLLRIENDLGEVAAEVWKEKYLHVATSEGGAISKGTSVVMENRNQRFVVRVVRRPRVLRAAGAPLVPINLTIKIPESARVEINTINGRVTMSGVPTSAAVKSVAGDVDVEFLDSANAEIAARSTTGFIKSELPQLQSENGHVLQARVGTGAQALSINTGKGNITLSLRSKSADAVALETTGTRPPSALHAEVATKAAGTPAPALDTQE